MPATILEEPSFTHVTVMPDEVVQAFAGTTGLVIDATAGGGGHSHALLSRYPELRLLAFDRDETAVRAASERLSEFGLRARVEHLSFSRIGERLDELGIEEVSGVIADLGVSSQQLALADRGMSFRLEGPLDMRMDTSTGETAAELIERVSQEELADLIYDLGEERGSRRIARCIKQALARGELTTTLDLRRAVVKAIGPRRTGGVDPATRTFQALRIAVNAEIDELSSLLDFSRKRLMDGGVAAFISFHSLEDRRVKREFMKRDFWQRLTPKPIVASEGEQAQNPRSRSAKLRVGRRHSPLSFDIDAEEE
ncbi:MAG TPA: 16S rRNA (cytosine(1402)-N(4))-methyltransferase RsmH [Polyangiaceae bacterium]|nr:16S rRNA (cytosine(1402)-N(4))-methyltransferase RsmH [Polyangiaceae bacterium]